MSAEEVAEVGRLLRHAPAGVRMLTVSLRPMSEGSWG